MTDNIQSIFNMNIKLIGLMHKAVIHFRRSEYDKALSIIADSMGNINIITDAIIKDREYFNLVSTDSVVEMLQGIVNSQKDKDYILLADLIELQIIMLLCNVQEMIINKEDFYIFSQEKYEKMIGIMLKKITNSADAFDKIIEGLDPELLLERGYRIEFTSCGQMTLAVTDTKGLSYYMHSNHIITGEAFSTAATWYEKGIKRYIILGFGLGYVINELLMLISDEDAEIIIYEHDINILKLSCGFSGIEDMYEDSRFRIIYDPELEHIRHDICNDKEEKVCIFYPSLRYIKEPETRKYFAAHLPWADMV